MVKVRMAPVPPPEETSWREQAITATDREKIRALGSTPHAIARFYGVRVAIIRRILRGGGPSALTTPPLPATYPGRTPSANLTVEDVRAIRQHFVAGDSIAAIARSFQVGRSAVNRALTAPAAAPPHARRHARKVVLSDADLLALRGRIVALAEEYGVSLQEIVALARGTERLRSLLYNTQADAADDASPSPADTSQ